MSWSAAQYRKFEDERNRPILDLLAHVPTATVAHAIDIGCGPGNSTELMRNRYPEARISGLDSSDDMIAAARRRMPDVDFSVADIAGWSPAERYDLILANAVLQWLPDHAALFPRLFGKLAPDGTLAVQMPDNLDEPAHRLMREVAADGPWSAKLATAWQSRAPRHEADYYFRLLHGRAQRLDVWRTVYHHPLPDGAAGIVEWFKGSGLRPYLDPLDAEERDAYLARYEAAVADAYPALADGTVLLPFPRLFLLAQRPG
ncbi:trans-aconitate 2-methyltransferase [Flavisphingomonas formosensis]|uniref:trans-aconitate 2-methyltransferase n=1 Tax=Flavisphingomonas formosensis TaxID=861534 RepID=UPI0012F9A716|nr:trans-aconitate 2-methyltransferase [Sphingomonas formosensis]